MGQWSVEGVGHDRARKIRAFSIRAVRSSDVRPGGRLHQACPPGGPEGTEQQRFTVPFLVIDVLAAGFQTQKPGSMVLAAFEHKTFSALSGEWDCEEWRRSLPLRQTR